MSPDRPTVSIVVPCRNERRHIARCLESILANDYPQERLEILVVDGMSDDGTPFIVEEYAARAGAIRLIPNSRQIVSSALNLGIGQARGEVILRMDAHCEYPSDYIPGLIGWLERTGADNVGGACVTRPANDSAIARAIALALSHPFGVGNSHFRLGVAEPRLVDTVPFGCFRRGLFERIGLFDEELVRNQDDELNFRILRAGGRVLLVPGIVSQYYARESFGKLAAMYYQYGYFKPLVAYKVGRIMTVRQLVPPVLTVAIVLGGIFALWAAPVLVGMAGLLGAYGAAALLCALGVVPRQGLACSAALLVAFPVLHFSYGVGFLLGAAALLRRGRSAPAESVPLAPTR
jgi:glycosyltransferase involved in cell wall biosynthesis